MRQQHVEFLRATWHADAFGDLIVALVLALQYALPQSILHKPLNPLSHQDQSIVLF